APGAPEERIVRASRHAEDENGRPGSVAGLSRILSRGAIRGPRAPALAESASGRSPERTAFDTRTRGESSQLCVTAVRATGRKLRVPNRGWNDRCYAPASAPSISSIDVNLTRG